MAVTTAKTLEEVLKSLSQEGELYHPLEKNKVLCFACGHRCIILEGRSGVCRVRFNEEGKLYVPWGYVGALQCDPIEKKPFFHAYPGSLAFSFGMLGCDYHCSYCQNWLTSQALRDPAAIAPIYRITPEALVDLARRYEAKVIASTYNEPLITSEWAVAIFKEAKKRGFVGAYISNGNATPEVLDYLRPWVDLYKVDLKSFNDRNYRRLGGRLSVVLETLENLLARDFWVEVVTLVVPGFNDSEEELRSIARFLARLSPDIPWHVTAFHKDYKMTDPENTTAEQLIRAANIGKEEGLRFVYAGNLPGQVGDLENTYCPDCHALLIERIGYRIRKYRLEPGGFCPECSRPVPGRWD